MHFQGLSNSVLLNRPEVPCSTESTALLGLFVIIKQYLNVRMILGSSFRLKKVERERNFLGSFPCVWSCRGRGRIFIHVPSNYQLS